MTDRKSPTMRTGAAVALALALGVLGGGIGAATTWAVMNPQLQEAVATTGIWTAAANVNASSLETCHQAASDAADATEDINTASTDVLDAGQDFFTSGGYYAGDSQRFTDELIDADDRIRAATSTISDAAADCSNQEAVAGP